MSSGAALPTSAMPRVGGGSLFLYHISFILPYTEVVVNPNGSHTGLTKSYKVLYLFFSICKALQSLIFGYFRPKRSYKVLFFYRKGDFRIDKVM